MPPGSQSTVSELTSSPPEPTPSLTTLLSLLLVLTLILSRHPHLGQPTSVRLLFCSPGRLLSALHLASMLILLRLLPLPRSTPHLALVLFLSLSLSGSTPPLGLLLSLFVLSLFVLSLFVLSLFVQDLSGGQGQLPLLQLLFLLVLFLFWGLQAGQH
ncbi:hypothetical protein Q8A73_005197 [Channa argus]|nr:hypothetical protein Q8A73_005197 [Channa argus]